MLNTKVSTMKRMGNIGVMFLLFLATCAFAQQQKVLDGWKISPEVTAIEENGKGVLSVQDKQGSLARNLSREDNYIQFRLEKCSRLYITGKKFQLPPICPKPGVYTIPATGNDAEKLTSFHIRFFPGDFVFSDFKCFAAPQANGVFVEKNGEELVISMPVKEKPDSLSLTLYAADTGKNWKFKGQLMRLDWPGVPARLTMEEDGVYRARFKLPTLPHDFSAPAMTLIAEVFMAGGDNLNLGNYYGFFPFDVKIKASKLQTEDARLKLYDLGPANIMPQAGAIRGDKDLVWQGLGECRGNGGRIAWLEPMLSTWAEVAPGKTATANLRVGKGKYLVSIGIGSKTLPSYASHQHEPTSGCVKINGKEIFRRNAAEQDRDVLMRRMADEDDNLYRTYFKDLVFFDVEAETEATDTGIKLEFVADPQKIMVLNYILLFPADDQDARELLKRQRIAREEKYNQFLVLEKPRQQSFPMKTPFAVFPRENPDDNVEPNTLPSETEQKGPLKLFGASGEMLSGTFFVRTGDKAIHKLTVKLNGLQGELYNIMYIHHSTPSERRAWIGANHLLPAMPIDLKPFYSYAWRMRLKGPARPGKYSGNIEVTADGHTEKLPVEVTIHPLKLPELNDHYIAMDGDGIEGPYAADLMRFAKEELGCTTAHLRMAWPTSSRFELDQNGMPVKVVSVGAYDEKRYDEWLDAFIKADFPVKTPWIGLMSIASKKEPFNQGPFKPFSKEYCQAVKLSYEFLRDRAQKKGLPGILVDFGGEMGVGLHVPSEQTISSAIKLYQLVNGMPSVKTSYRCNCYATVERFNPYLDVQGVRGKLSWKSADQITELGTKKHIYSYSVGGRFLNGYHSWAHGARGNLREYMCYDHEYYRHRPKMGGASSTHDQSVMSGVNKPLLTVRSEDFRGSVVDRQYLRLLDEAIAKTPHSHARTKAEALRNMLRNTCLNYNFTDHNTTGSSPWECIRLDLMRRAIVECVMAMQKNDATSLPEYKTLALSHTVEKPEMPQIDIGSVPMEAQQDFNDTAWPKINTGTWESQGYIYDGSAWYRKTFDLKELDNPRIVFEGVDEQAWIWLNGKYIGHHDGWDKPFSFPLEQAAVAGKNTLSILVYDSAYQGGIWKPAKVVNGTSEQVLNNWSFLLKPGRQKLNTFQLKDGPLVPAGSSKLCLSILLFDFDDFRLNPDMEVWLDGKKLPVKVVPYQKLTLDIPVPPLTKGAHNLLLKSAGQNAISYDFYGI